MEWKIEFEANSSHIDVNNSIVERNHLEVGEEMSDVDLIPSQNTVLNNSLFYPTVKVSNFKASSAGRLHHY